MTYPAGLLPGTQDYLSDGTGRIYAAPGVPLLPWAQREDEEEAP